MAATSGLAIASYAMMAAAAAATAYSTYQGGKAQQRAYNLQAEQDEKNARQKALEASINEDTLRREGRQKLARMSAAQSEAGLEGGTATTAYMSSFKNVEQEALNLRYQGMSQWANYKNSAALNRMYGRQAYEQGKMGALVTGLSGLAQMGAVYASSYTPAQATQPQTTGNTLAAGGTSSRMGVSYMGKNPYYFYGG